MNSSFSPPLARRRERWIQSDSSHDAYVRPVDSSSFSGPSKGDSSGGSSDQHPNHHYSISDGALSYYGSLSDSGQVSHWTPPLRRYDMGEFSTPAGGARPEAASVLYHRSGVRRFPSGPSSVPNSLGSASSPSELNQWAFTSKQPIFFPPRNIPGRRSFMSKPVHPIVFRNPASDGDPSMSSRMQPGDSNRTSPLWHDSIQSPDVKFHKTLSELDKLEASPEPGGSSRREGFRWSNASSYDFGFDADAIEIMEHVSPDNARYPANSARYEKCKLCERLLWQKSPWSSNRIIRNGDMPVAAVLACRHFFHADCLEETTPRSQAHEPPCPLCLKMVDVEGTTSLSEPLHEALRSVRKKRASNGAGSSRGPNRNCEEKSTKHRLSLPVVRRGGSLLKDHFRKRFSFKGKRGKDLISTKDFSMMGASSSKSSLLHDGRSRSEHL